MKTLLLSRDDVKKAIDMDAMIAAVSEAYKPFQKAAVSQPPVVSVFMPEFKGDSDIKACYNTLNKMYSVKVASLYEENGKINNLPAMMGTVLLYDGRDGQALAIMDGGLITGARTGAAGAVSCKFLSREDAHTLCVFGAGGQARMQAEAISRVRDIREIRVYAEPKEAMAVYKKDMESMVTGIRVVICETPAEALRGADIAVSTTPTKKFIASKEDLSGANPGLHIVAVGADEAGKNEWDPAIFAMADKIVCDSKAQCFERGETRNAVVSGAIKEADVYAEIGELVSGEKAGRTSEIELTIFDTTGMGVQDNAAAAAIYETAKKLGLGTEFAFL